MKLPAVPPRRRAEQRGTDAAAEQRRPDATRHRARGNTLVTGITLVAATLGVRPAIIVMPAGVGRGGGERRYGDGERNQGAHRSILSVKSLRTRREPG